MFLNAVAVLNLCLIITHQIDAAFWHEWEMFRIPGGIQLFNILNLLIFIPLLMCLLAVSQRSRSGYYGSYILALAGSLIFFIHAGFALAGYTQFNLPVSVFVIAASLVVSVTQAIMTFLNREEFNGFRK